MQIIDLVVDIVEWDVATIPVVDERGYIGGRLRYGVVRVRTDPDLGATGLIGPLDGELAPCLAQLTDVIKPRLVGRRLTEPDQIWTRLDRWAGHGFPLQPAMAAVDIALWDAVARARGLPLFALLGGHSREIPAVATSPPVHARPELVVEQVLEAVERGFRAYKIHPGAVPESDAIRLAGMAREAVGSTVALVFDPNNSYDLTKALAVGMALDEAGFAWYEDPVAPDDWTGILRLADALRTPLAMSDAIGFLAHQARLALRLGAPQIVRVSARKLGVTGLKELCDELSAAGMPFEIGFGGNPLANAANLHVASSVAGRTYYEHMLPAGYHETGVLSPVQVNNGAALASPRPGLGVELDPDLVARHTITRLG
ncbi:MAG: mandelate racemase/muconate lactonizing enzyme family protein [bacterium]|nr:mandelate racemase/muconate lactonizing enzyme family protein [bacterium]MDE0352397.1 mandelate racemase/muconate lactonizing enzyme family protein [bacterium]